ncbi:MAG: type I pantothenate kinase [Pseudomonadota bacterium]
MTDQDHLQALAALIGARAAGGGPGALLVGIAGGVAAGKSTLARLIGEGLAAQGLPVEIVATDGFLKPNAELEAAGLGMKKGFPETYDTAALHAFLGEVAAGRTAEIPVYSHVTYDILPGEARSVAATGVVIVEGINVLQTEGARERFGISLYVDADPAHAKAWYLARLHGIIAADPESFFARLDAERRDAMFEAAWTHLNLVNLREHIAPTMAYADVVVRKGADHGIVALEVR